MGARGPQAGGPTPHLGCGAVYHLLGGEVTLVAHQELVDVLAGIAVNLLQPLFHVGVRLLGGQATKLPMPAGARGRPLPTRLSLPLPCPAPQQLTLLQAQAHVGASGPGRQRGDGIAGGHQWDTVSPWWRQHAWPNGDIEALSPDPKWTQATVLSTLWGRCPGGTPLVSSQLGLHLQTTCPGPRLGGDATGRPYAGGRRGRAQRV